MGANSKDIATEAEREDWVIITIRDGTEGEKGIKITSEGQSVQMWMNDWE